MRRIVTALAAAALAASSAVAAGSAPGSPGLGYIATNNLELVFSMPLNADSAGARLVGKVMYVTDDRGLTTYDVSVPEAPSLLGFVPVPQEPYVPEEDVDTNGKTLLIGSLGTLNVLDVSNPAAPVVTATLDGADAHTVTCVLDCQYAWLNSGDIVDLRNLEAPRVAGKWTTGMPAKSSHDVTEIAPGLVVTSSNPVLYLDARKSPLKPTLLAVGRPGDDRFMHGAIWPRKGNDRFLLMGGETVGNCDTDSAGAFMVFDTAGWQKSKSLKMVDEFRLTTGLPTDGNSVYDQFCAHWFTAHPSFRNGGVVAVGWYEHGTRLLDVSAKGQISEIGWFLPLGGSTSAAYWVGPRTIYVLDYQRGLDVIRWNGAKATGVERHGNQTPLPRAPLRFRTEVAPSPERPWYCPRPVGALDL